MWADLYVFMIWTCPSGDADMIAAKVFVITFLANATHNNIYILGRAHRLW